jgi:hypothetical protein
MSTQVAAALGRLRSMLAAEAVTHRFALFAASYRQKYDPNQPRVPAGNSDGGQWTSGGGGGGRPSGGVGRTGGGINDRRVLSDAPDDKLKPGAQYAQNTPRGPRGSGTSRIVGGRRVELTPAQQTRAEIAESQADAATSRVRTLDPTWQPSPRLDSSVESYISNTQATAREAQARYETLRSGIGGNSGAFPANPVPVAPRVEPQTAITNFRASINSRDLFGNETVRSDKGAVAYAELDGEPHYGVSSDMPGYTSIDRRVAQGTVDTLVTKYPDTMSQGNLGWKPNDALYHAEATILLRMERSSGGTLVGRSITVHVDRDLCTSCATVLPKLALELGNPYVTIVDPTYTHVMRDGRWISRTRR